MGDEATIQKSLLEQILDDMLARVERREEFDVLSIEKLKQLAQSGDLTKPKQVAAAIKLASEEQHESA